jgi:putative membrane protein
METAMKYLVIAAAAIFSFAGFATGADAGSKARTFTEAGEFAQALKSSGHFEITSSAIALQNSDNDEVKKFAQKMIDDHKAADQKLMDTLKQANLPEPEYAMLEEQTEMVQNLEPLHGARFDRRYLQDQVQGHREAIQLIEGYTKRGDNDALKQLASSLLPTIEEHYRMAQQLSAGGATARR